MGGPAASGDLEQGHLTQTWLAISDDPAARRSGEVWHHRRPTTTAAAARSTDFQDRLLDRLADLTGYELPTRGMIPGDAASAATTTPDRHGLHPCQ